MLSGFFVINSGSNTISGNLYLNLPVEYKTEEENQLYLWTIMFIIIGNLYVLLYLLFN